MKSVVKNCTALSGLIIAEQHRRLIQDVHNAERGKGEK